eukprot:11569733-Karenia_brevis.AAC.1
MIVDGDMLIARVWRPAVANAEIHVLPGVEDMTGDFDKNEFHEKLEKKAFGREFYLIAKNS